MRVLATITKPAAVRAILDPLGLRADPMPRAPARDATWDHATRRGRRRRRGHRARAARCHDPPRGARRWPSTRPYPPCRDGSPAFRQRDGRPVVGVVDVESLRGNIQGGQRKAEGRSFPPTRQPPGRSSSTSASPRTPSPPDRAHANPPRSGRTRPPRRRRAGDGDADAGGAGRTARP
jgi:hypothetical protein